MRSFLYKITIDDPVLTVHARRLIQGDLGRQAIDDFQLWLTNVRDLYNTEFVEGMHVRNTNGNIITATITSVGTFGTPGVVEEDVVVHCVEVFAAILGNLLNQQNIKNEVLYTGYDFEENGYNTVGPVTDAVERLPEAVEEYKDNAQEIIDKVQDELSEAGEAIKQAWTDAKGALKVAIVAGGALAFIWISHKWRTT